MPFDQPVHININRDFSDQSYHTLYYSTRHTFDSEHFQCVYTAIYMSHALETTQKCCNNMNAPLTPNARPFVMDRSHFIMSNTHIARVT